MTIAGVARSVALLALTTITAACQRSSANEPSPLASAQGAPKECEACRSLDRLDGRTPLPLLPHMASHQRESMRDHLLAVQQIVTAVAVADFEGVEGASRRLGSSEQMNQMCTHMGAGADGFTARALDFHRTADAITDAARRRDPERVLSTLGATLQRCTSCHAKYRQQVVDEASFSRITRGSPR